jgi:hypothetical protein
MTAADSRSNVHLPAARADGAGLSMTIRFLVTFAAICLFGTSANAMTMQECRAQYKAEIKERGTWSWAAYQVKICGFPKDNPPTQKPAAKH